MRFSYYIQKTGPWLAIFGLTGLLFLLINYLHLDFTTKLALTGIIAVISWYAYNRMNDFALNKGLDGEYEVLKVLRTLPEEYLRIRDFKLGKSGNIDFIVVGPTGVWAIEVKNHKTKNITIVNDELYGDGFSIDELRKQTYSGAKVLQDYLNSQNIFCPVNPLLVFTNPETEIRLGKRRVNGVSIVGIKWLKKIITEQEESLTSENRDHIKKEIIKKTSIL